MRQHHRKSTEPTQRDLGRLGGVSLPWFTPGEHTALELLVGSVSGQAGNPQLSICLCRRTEVRGFARQQQRTRPVHQKLQLLDSAWERTTFLAASKKLCRGRKFSVVQLSLK